MAETNGSILSFCIAFALSKVRLQYGKRFVKLGMTEAERYAAADQVIAHLRRNGGWKELDDEVMPVHQWDRDSQHKPKAYPDAPTHDWA